MKDWRERMNLSRAEIDELSAESMAVNRIMKSMGASIKQIGSLCKRFGIPYDENETSFQRAVSIFREVYAQASHVLVFDSKSAQKLDDILDDIMSDARPAIIFFRQERSKDREAFLRSFVRGQDLPSSTLGQIVIKPGICYVCCKNGLQLWEQDPVTLLKSFKKEENEYADTIR